MYNYFQNIFPKISGSQEDNQISIFGCPHSFFGRRGHEDARILLPCKLTQRCRREVHWGDRTLMVGGEALKELDCSRGNPEY